MAIEMIVNNIAKMIYLLLFISDLSFGIYFMTTPSFQEAVLHRFHYPCMQMRYPPVAVQHFPMSVHHHDGSFVAADTVVLKHFFSMRG